MNKTELVAALAGKSGLTVKDSAAAVSAFTEIVAAELGKRGEVAIPGFGTFGVKDRAARTGRNPATGKEIEIPAATVPYFKPGRSLKDAAAKK